MLRKLTTPQIHKVDGDTAVHPALYLTFVPPSGAGAGRHTPGQQRTQRRNQRRRSERQAITSRAGAKPSNKRTDPNQADSPLVVTTKCTDMHATRRVAQSVRQRDYSEARRTGLGSITWQPCMKLQTQNCDFTSSALTSCPDRQWRASATAIEQKHVALYRHAASWRTTVGVEGQHRHSLCRR